VLKQPIASLESAMQSNSMVFSRPLQWASGADKLSFIAMFRTGRLLLILQASIFLALILFSAPAAAIWKNYLTSKEALAACLADPDVGSGGYMCRGPHYYTCPTNGCYYTHTDSGMGLHVEYAFSVV
jgi:hypothetical protein